LREARQIGLGAPLGPLSVTTPLPQPILGPQFPSSSGFDGIPPPPNYPGSPVQPIGAIPGPPGQTFTNGLPGFGPIQSPGLGPFGPLASPGITPSATFPFPASFPGQPSIVGSPFGLPPSRPFPALPGFGGILPQAPPPLPPNFPFPAQTPSGAIPGPLGQSFTHGPPGFGPIPSPGFGPLGPITSSAISPAAGFPFPPSIPGQPPLFGSPFGPGSQSQQLPIPFMTPSMNLNQFPGFGASSPAVFGMSQFQSPQLSQISRPIGLGAQNNIFGFGAQFNQNLGFGLPGQLPYPGTPAGFGGFGSPVPNQSPLGLNSPPIGGFRPGFGNIF